MKCKNSSHIANMLTYKPLLIKPNLAQLEMLPLFIPPLLHTATTFFNLSNPTIHWQHSQQ